MHRSTLWTIAVLLCACDPQAPGATGTIDLDPSIDPAGYGWLQIVAHADRDGAFQVADLDPDKLGGDLIHDNFPLGDVSFPFDYTLGYGVGSTEIPTWRVTAWLSVEQAVTAPEVGDPWASASFEVHKCGNMGYCGRTDGVDLVIDTLFE